MTRPQYPTGTRAWGKGRLLVVLVALVVAGLVVLTGMGLLVAASLTPRSMSITAATAPGPSRDVDRRDSLAARAMLAVSDADSRGGTPVATPGPSIVIPGSTVIGPARVPSGFPHTPAGAIGQLTAIEIAVLMQMSVAGTGEIYQSWIMPGAPALDRWPLMMHVQAFLAAAGLGPAKDPTTLIQWSRAAREAQSKAKTTTDGRIGVIDPATGDVALDGSRIGTLPSEAHASKFLVAAAAAAGYPTRCQLRLIREPGKALRVVADLP